MKKYLIALLLMMFTVPAFAGPYHHHHRHHGHHHWNHSHPGRWIAPVIIGGAIGYALAQPAPVVVQQQPVIINSSSNCTEWKEVMRPDGVIVRERYCNNVNSYR